MYSYEARIRAVSRAGEVWDNSAMESFFSSLKMERTARKVFISDPLFSIGSLSWAARKRWLWHSHVWDQG